MTRIINDNGTDRPMTPDEETHYDQVVAQIEAEMQATENARLAKQATRTAALAKLGLTADEIAALFG